MTTTRHERPGPLVAALAYAAVGWPVLPLHTPVRGGGCSCRTAGCARAGKHPRTRRGLSDATTRGEQLTAWWQRWPDANVGIRTGRLVVVDVDGPDGGLALTELEAAHKPLPATRRAQTTRGQHIYFRIAGRVIPCSAGQLAPGIDVRGNGGYIVAPPSLHRSGQRYRWITSDDVAPLPPWLARLLTAAETPAQERAPLPPIVAAGVGERARRYVQAALDAELTTVTTAPVGTRNTTLNRAAFRLGQLAGAGLAARDTLANALLHAARSAGLGDTEAKPTIASGLGAGERHPRPLPNTSRQ
jgi:bifunctional DNA primase/polymerase-like protein